MINLLKHNLKKLQQQLTVFLPENLHHKQQLSLLNVVIGIIKSGSLRISAIGKGLAQTKCLKPKHAIKQIDRLLSNKKFPQAKIQAAFIKKLLAGKKEIVVTLDWTFFLKDKQTTLSLRHVTRHGRAIPLVWLTVDTDGLEGKKVEYENELLTQFKNLLPKTCKVTLLADREFGSIERFERLKQQYRFDYVIRFRNNYYVTNAKGVSKKAADWLGGKMQNRTLQSCTITSQYYPMAKIVICRNPKMKTCWCLASSIDKLSLKNIKFYYSKRWSTESSCRDETDILFGWGLSKTHLSQTNRRDRLFLLSALAMTMVTLLGQVSEMLGLDKHLRANTVTKGRTHSLFSQGCYLFNALCHQSKEIQLKVWHKFQALLAKHTAFKGIFSII